MWDKTSQRSHQPDVDSALIGVGGYYLQIQEIWVSIPNHAKHAAHRDRSPILSLHASTQAHQGMAVGQQIPYCQHSSPYRIQPQLLVCLGHQVLIHQPQMGYLEEGLMEGGGMKQEGTPNECNSGHWNQSRGLVSRSLLRHHSGRSHQCIINLTSTNLQYQ